MIDVDVRHLGKLDLDEYLDKDTIAALLGAYPDFSSSQSGCHKWLTESLPKRMVYSYLYGDILTGLPSAVSVVDVGGGGVTALTRILARNSRYTLIDLLAHDDKQAAEKLLIECGARLNQEDWYESNPDVPIDILIANDLFPNVDQRLGIFLDKYTPIARESRILLTYYSNERFYKVKRTDADELMFLRAWTGHDVANELGRRFPSIPLSHLNAFICPEDSLYANGRNISILTLRRTEE